MKIKTITLLCGFFLVNMSYAKTTSPQVKYSLSMPQPHTHYFEVQIDIEGLKKDFLDFKMPVWAPGSYLVREFSKSVEEFEAKSSVETLKTKKINKNTWRVFSNKHNKIQVSYKIYAFEMSVRTSFLDVSHAYLNGTSVFMYLDETRQKPLHLTITPYSTWKKVSTALEPVAKKTWTYFAPNYDVLVDCPIEIGNHKTDEFLVNKTLHKIAVFGEGNYVMDTLKKDITKIVSSCTDIFGENPNDYYLFIIHNLIKRSGGLEHKNSTTLQVNRWTYKPKKAYNSFLSLVAHEYFHLWNVQRIKPYNFKSLDYDQENYTSLLWIMEGFTSYYDELILRRANFWSEKEYLNTFAENLAKVENRPGNAVQSVTDASFDAWIKFYRPNENSVNTTVSYYYKGAILAAMLDLAIIHKTQGQKNLDDVMRYMYHEIYKKQKRGIRDNELKGIVEKVAGTKMDDFFENYVSNTEPIDYQTFFTYAGYKLIAKQDTGRVSLGIHYANNDGKLVVNSVLRETSAYEAGVNANDEIIAVDGYRVDHTKLGKILDNYKVGDKISLTIAREGVLQTIPIELKESTAKVYMLKSVESPTSSQVLVRNKWLNLKK